MIRVIYRWRVNPGGEQAFQQAWEQGTKAIMRAVEGSHGSLLMRCGDTPSEFAGMAKWESFEAWRAAHKSPNWPPDREATRVVHRVAGKTISREIFEELSDLTDV
ncbi:MAG: antibiotic biosynthesis monooxygenase family protein [Candidatus Binataceae bacterium]